MHFWHEEDYVPYVPNSKWRTHSAVLSVVQTTTTQRRFWYRCENCGPLLTSGCHLGPPGDGSPAGAGACIYLGSVPTLHYSAQPGPHLQPPPVNTTALASLYVIKTCCLVDQVQPVFALIWPILPIFSALLQFCLPSSPGSFIQKLPWIPHTAVALKWKQSVFLESKYLKNFFNIFMLQYKYKWVFPRQEQMPILLNISMGKVESRGCLQIF